MNNKKTTQRNFCIFWSLSSWKMKLTAIILICVVFSCIYFLISQNHALHNQQKASSLKEDVKLSQALQHFMIREQGMYTLLGSKPMTIFIFESSPLTEEEKFKEYQELPQAIRTQYSYSDMQFLKNHEQLWNYWVQYADKNPQKNFLLSKRGNMGIFVNVTETAWVLNKHYDLFHEKTQQHFNPVEIIYELKEPTSSFWNQVDKLENHDLWGLLLGYGEKNAYLFQLLMEKKVPDRGFFSSEEERSRPLFKIPLDMEDLPLPTFRTFSIADNRLEQYKRERAHIIQLFQGKNFLEEVLFYLNKKPLSNPPYIMHALSKNDASYLSNRKGSLDIFGGFDIIDVIVFTKDKDLKDRILEEFSKKAKEHKISVVDQEDFIKNYPKYSKQWKNDAYYTIKIVHSEDSNTGTIQTNLDAYATLDKDQDTALVSLYHSVKHFSYSEEQFSEKALEATLPIIDQFINTIAPNKDSHHSTPSLLLIR